VAQVNGHILRHAADGQLHRAYGGRRLPFQRTHAGGAVGEETGTIDAARQRMRETGSAPKRAERAAEKRAAAGIAEIDLVCQTVVVLPRSDNTVRRWRNDGGAHARLRGVDVAARVWRLSDA